jgi:putative ABC transport system permease protein
VISNPADQLGSLRGALGGLIAVLALIALTGLLTSSRVGIRDHQRDVQVLRAMGLTPAQVKTAVVVRMTVLALVAAAFGAALGRAVSSDLISAMSRTYGLGAGLGRPAPVGTVLAATGLAVATAAVAGILAARTQEQIPAAVVLGP